MPILKVSISDPGMELMQAAADYEELPISAWLRNVGLKEARATAHRKLCATVKIEEYRWAGRPCSREYYEERMTEATGRPSAADIKRENAILKSRISDGE